MKLIFTSYSSSPEYDQPRPWLERINGYTGILEALSKSHTVTGIERINYEGEYIQEDVQYFFIRLKQRVIYFPLRMHRLIKRQRPDIVFINGLIFPLQVIQLRLKLGRRVRIIIIHRSEKPFSGIKRYLQRLADKCVNAYLFTSSEFGNEWIRKGNLGNAKKIYEVMHGSSTFHPEENAKTKSSLSITGFPVFVWVGRLNVNKDPLTVVKGFASFLFSQPSAKLYMIYQTEELLQDIKELVEDKKLAESIILVGKISHSQLQEWYNSADFIISSSYYEGGGIAVCEAMSCGCIPILTDIISFRRMTGPGKCGFLYEPGNEKDLLSVLSATKELDIEKEKAKVIKQFNEELSFEAIAEKIEKIIVSI